MARRKHRKLHQDAELDITAFMNLMIVLVPVLLVSMVFARTSVLDLNFPIIDEAAHSSENEEKLQLQLIVRQDSLHVADSKAGLIQSIARKEGEHDFAALSKLLQQIKARLPEKTDITLLLEQDVDYQTLVTAMDTTRSYKAVVAASVVDAELFPDISIGDAPALLQAGGGTP